MMLKKKKSIGSEKKINNNWFKVTVGTIDKHNPKTIYINNGVFITPINEKNDYNTDFNHIKKSLKISIDSCLKNSDLFKEKYILNFEVPLNALKKGKKSHLFLQYHLMQKNNTPLSIDELIEDNEGLFNNVLFDLKNKLEEFNFSLSKTKK